MHPLWTSDLKGKTIGACFDAYIERELPKHKHSIGLSNENYYFNAGVLLIDLEKWNKIDVLDKSMNIVIEYGDLIKFQDQDILNILFKNDVYYLNTRYNFMPSQVEIMKRKSYRGEIECTHMPIIISHFCGPKKSWHDNCKHFNSYMYYYYVQNFENNTHLSIISKLNIFFKNLRMKIKYRIY